MTQDLLVDAIDTMRDHGATEVCQLFRRNEWLLTATMLPSLSPEDRSGVLELLPVATHADRVHHVAFTNATIDGRRTDAVSWLDAPVDPDAPSARLVLYPFTQHPGADITWSDPVEMGAESAIFGGLTDAFTAIASTLATLKPDEVDLVRATAIDHLTKVDIAVKMSEEFSAELHALLERVG